MSQNLFTQNKSVLLDKINLNDENPIGLRNNVISLIFLISALFSMLFLFIVILIHSKYTKFRRGIYSIIFACIISEYIYSLIYFIHGLDYLTFRVLETNDTICDVTSFFAVFLLTNLIIFNSLLIINCSQMSEYQILPLEI